MAHVDKIISDGKDVPLITRAKLYNILVTSLWIERREPLYVGEQFICNLNDEVLVPLVTFGNLVPAERRDDKILPKGSQLWFSILGKRLVTNYSDFYERIDVDTFYSEVDIRIDKIIFPN